MIEGRSPWVLAWRRLRQDKVAVASLIVILLLALLAILAPAIATWGRPSAGHDVHEQGPQ